MCIVYGSVAFIRNNKVKVAVSKTAFSQLSGNSIKGSYDDLTLKASLASK